MITRAADPREILHARAAALAQPAVVPAAPAAECPYVEFRVYDEILGFLLESVRGVEPCPFITPVPCTPDWLLGIVNVRGEILAVADLARFLALSGEPKMRRNRVVVVAASGVTVCIVVDEIRGAQTLDPGQLRPALPNPNGFRPEYVRGITDAGVTLLDAERLLSDPRFSINDSVDS